MSGGMVEELVKMSPSVAVAEVNEWLQSLRAPSIAVAEARAFSPSGAELEVMHQSMGKAQQWEDAGDVGKMVQGRECGKAWKVKMEEEILARVWEAWLCP